VIAVEKAVKLTKVKWNNDVVNGLGNLISRLLHLIELRGVVLDEKSLSENAVGRMKINTDSINNSFEKYDFKELGVLLNGIIFNLNRRITIEKPFDKNCDNYSEILNEIYFELKNIICYYGITIKGSKDKLNAAFNENKKVILFERI